MFVYSTDCLYTWAGHIALIKCHTYSEAAPTPKFSNSFEVIFIVSLIFWKYEDFYQSY